MFLPPRIAKRYAQAFLNTTQVEYAQIERIEASGKNLAHHLGALFYLKVPLKQDFGLIKAVDAFLARYRISTLLKKLVHLLARHNRLALLADVLQSIAQVYRARNNLLVCTVLSSSPLSTSQKKQIEQSIASRLQVTPYVTYGTDENLIAGIRIEAQYCVWEYSVAKKLRSLSSTVLEKVYRE